MANDRVEFGLTMAEARVVITILKTLVQRRYLPEKQHELVSQLLTRIEGVNMGERN